MGIVEVLVSTMTSGTKCCQGTCEQEQASGPISARALPGLLAPAFSWPPASCLSSFAAASFDWLGAKDGKGPHENFKFQETS